MKSSLFVAAVFSIAAIGCDGWNESVSSGDDPVRYTVTGQGNPLSWYGEKHNEALDWGFQQIPYGSITRATAIGMAADFAIQADPGDDYTPAVRHQLVALIEKSHTDYDHMSTAEVLDSLDALYLNPIQRSYMERTLAAIDQVAADPVGAVAELASIESAILTSSLAEDERAVPLMFVAVVKHSADYWLGYSGPGLPVGTGEMERRQSALARDGRGCLTGTLTGLAGGGLGGFLVGSFLGPAGSAAGAGGGALVGGIVGGFTGAIAGSLG